MGSFFDIIILLAVVITIFFKLKNVLGTRPEETTKITPLSEESAAKIFDIIMQENKQNGSILTTPKEEEKNLSPLEEELRKLPSFNKDNFINGARRAFEIIVTAFAKADIETLQSLVSPKLAKKFEEILQQRKQNGITAETDFIGFVSTDIKDLKITKNNIAKIVVQFISEQVNLLKDKNDKIIEGDENFVQSITDVWTFERNLNSTNPNWLLISTKKS